MYMYYIMYTGRSILNSEFQSLPRPTLIVLPSRWLG